MNEPYWFLILYHIYTFLHIPDVQDGNKKAKVEEYEENAEDDYEEWKHRILESAHKALGKPYKRH